MTFEELLRKEDKSEVEQTLIQSICSLTSHPLYQSCTPWEVYDKQVGLAKETAAKIEELACR